MSRQTQSSIKEEEMDTEQDMNGEIKMSGEKMKEENTMTDKKANDRSRRQIISAAAPAVQFSQGLSKAMTRAINGDDRR